MLTGAPASDLTAGVTQGFFTLGEASPRRTKSLCLRITGRDLMQAAGRGPVAWSLGDGGLGITGLNRALKPPMLIMEFSTHYF